jgi:hypothetical protein
LLRAYGPLPEGSIAIVDGQPALSMNVLATSPNMEFWRTAFFDGPLSRLVTFQVYTLPTGASRSFAFFGEAPLYNPTAIIQPVHVAR